MTDWSPIRPVIKGAINRIGRQQNLSNLYDLLIKRIGQNEVLLSIYHNITHSRDLRMDKKLVISENYSFNDSGEEKKKEKKEKKTFGHYT